MRSLQSCSHVTDEGMAAQKSDPPKFIHVVNGGDRLTSHSEPVRLTSESNQGTKGNEDRQQELPTLDRY